MDRTLITNKDQMFLTDQYIKDNEKEIRLVSWNYDEVIKVSSVELAKI